MIEPLHPSEIDFSSISDVTDSSSSSSSSNSLNEKTISEFCLAPNWLGDNYCDDDNNVAECNYDDGDCCEHNKEAGNANWDAFCSICEPMKC